MSQQPQFSMKNKFSNAIHKLKGVLEQCARLKSDLHSIKNLTFKEKRKMNVNIKSVRDAVKISSKTILQQKVKISRCEEDDKENNFNAMNRLSDITVILPHKEKDANNFWKESESKLSQRIMLELQQIKLLEQRQNLISKKNQRMTNYYSQNKKRLDFTRSQVLQYQQ